jgi:hypothetical protein
MLKVYLEHNPKPKVVVQNLDSFSFQTTPMGQIYEPDIYLPYLGDAELFRSLYQIDPVVWKWRYIPLYGFAVDDMKFMWIRGLLADVGVFGKAGYFKGYNPRSTPWNDDFQRFRIEHPSGVRYRIEAGGVGSVVELIHICKANSIHLVFVYSPEYVKMQPLESNRSEIFARFEEIAKRFSIPFIDYSSSSISSRQDLFQNSQHLNVTGAEMFSADLGSKLLKWEQSESSRRSN